MKRFLLYGCLVVGLSASAQVLGPVQPPTPAQAGVNEAIQITNHSGTWVGYGKSNGSYRPFKRLIPVSREAFATLLRLDKKEQYNCIMIQATYVSDEKGLESGFHVPMRDYLIGTFYVIDINCGS